EKREAQRVLAQEVTTLVHGAEQLSRAQRATSLLFGEDSATVAAYYVLSVMGDVPSAEISAAEFSGGVGIVDLIARVQLAPSKAEARRLVPSGGGYLNNRGISD